MNNLTFTAALAKERVQQLCLDEGDALAVLFVENENIVPGRQTKFPKSISAILPEVYLDESTSELIVLHKGETLRISFARLRNIFRHPPDILPIPTTGDYRLEKAFTFKWRDSKGFKYRMTIPEAFPYDGNSVPRVLISLSGVERDGSMRTAALVHDWIYVNGGRVQPGHIRQQRWENDEWKEMPDGTWLRWDADRLYGLILRDELITKRQRRRMFSAVYYNGWALWNDPQDKKRGLVGNILLSAKGFLKLLGTAFIPKTEV